MAVNDPNTVSSTLTPGASRRGFLRSLAGLPLIGGSLAISGDPVAAAVPVTAEMLDSYEAFLANEHRALVRERYARFGDDAVKGMMRVIPHNTAADFLHFRSDSVDLIWAPSTRAAVILSAAGVPLI